MDKNSAPQFSCDYYRMSGRTWEKENVFRRCLCLLNSHALRYLLAYRKVRQGSDPLKISSFCLKRIQRKYGIALESSQIGKGLYLGHPYNITVGRYAEIGENCNLNKGAAIVPRKNSDEKAAPKLGNRVWVGVNAVVTGDITIGDNVLIAPNAYVDFDVPSDSIVIGNPAKIIPDRTDATEGYIHHVC